MIVPKPKDRYRATAKTYSPGARRDLAVVNAFRRAHRMPELTSISNVDPAAPGGDRTYMLSLGQPRGHSFFEMDFANVEMRVVAHQNAESYLIQQLTRAHAEYMDRVMRGEPGTVHVRPRLYESRSGRSLSREHPIRQVHISTPHLPVLNFAVQAQNAARVMDGLGRAIRDGMSIQSLDDIYAVLGMPGDPSAPAKPPEKPPHPDAGKLVERPRKMRRTLLGAEVADYREASGGVARVAQSEVDPIKPTNRRKRQ